MLPGANALEVATNVKEAMKEISQNFPEGLEYKFPFDATEYISQSIHEVYKTLFEALFLVVLVVFLSLQNWRAALIPTIAVPISLIGTFGADHGVLTQYVDFVRFDSSNRYCSG